MLKRLHKWYKAFIRRHIACWPEEYYNPYTPPSESPAADVNVLRSSVGRYFKYNQADRFYIIPYEPMYEQAIDGIREDGWQVALHADASGELFYSISTKKTPA
jgi:hypothetical protein